MKLFTRRLWKNAGPLFTDLVGKPVNYMEIGVFQGHTSEVILKHILTHPESKYYGIDPWEWHESFHKQFPTYDDYKSKVIDRIEILQNKYADKAEFIKGYSQNVLTEIKFENQSFDVIYIDGHHTILNVMRDFSLTWQLLKINGVMIFDDYGMINRDGVKIAVDFILQALKAREKDEVNRKAKCEIMFKNYQVGIRKLRE